MYVATKGGEKCDRGGAFMARTKSRRGDPSVPGTDPRRRSREQLAQSSIAPGHGRRARSSITGLAALAIKQARGDLIEAIFLIRAYRTTLPRFGASRPIDTGSDGLHARRISATYKDAPGGQVLGPTFDYTHRLARFRTGGGGRSTARGFKHRRGSNRTWPQSRTSPRS